MLVVGVDGCRGGWIAVTWDTINGTPVGGRRPSESLAPRNPTICSTLLSRLGQLAERPRMRVNAFRITLALIGED
jgi:hypothetical protein